MKIIENNLEHHLTSQNKSAIAKLYKENRWAIDSNIMGLSRQNSKFLFSGSKECY